jgi:hypothetical protein
MGTRSILILLLAALTVACGHGSSGTSASVPPSSPDGTGPQSAPQTSATMSEPASAAIVDPATGQPLAFVQADQPITGATADGTGGWYIGGDFSTVNGVARPHLAHITSDGTLDPVWRPELKARAGALSFLSITLAGGDVIVSGAFHEVLRRARHGLAAFDKVSGELDTGWVPTTACFDGSWHITSVGTRTYAATACGAGACVQARDAQGRELVGWNASLTAIGEMPCVDSLAVGGNSLYVTGGFTQIQRRARPGIGAVTLADGSVVDGFRPRGGCAGPEHAIAVGRRLVFTGGDLCPIAALDRRSGAPAWHIGRHDNASTAALATAGSRVFVGGEFGLLDGVQANGFAAFDQATGRVLPTWHPSSGGTLVFALSISDNRLLIAGRNL